MKGLHIDTIYPKLIRSVLDKGVKSSPRGMGVKEIFNVGFKLEDARNSIITNPHRKINYAYAAIEMLGNFRHGDKNVEPFCFYVPRMKQYLNPETNTWEGSYATRLQLYNQLPKMYEVLRADPSSRQAVISFYNPAHDFHDYQSNDICCTLSLIFCLREGKLNLTCTMRSNDVFLGLPYDLTQFTFLQSVLACWLGVEVGGYYHFTANLHAYEQDWEKLEIIASEPWPAGEALLPTMPTWDIPDIEKTYINIEKFFSLEKSTRQNQLNGADCESTVLREIFLNIIGPAINKKLSLDFSEKVRHNVIPNKAERLKT